MNVRPDFVNLQDKNTGIEERSFTMFLLKPSTMHVLCGFESRDNYISEFSQAVM